MKLFALLAGCGALAFLAMGYQAGLFENSPSAKTFGEDAKEEKEKDVPHVCFPDALVEAGRGKPVPQAAEYKKGPGPHPLVFFNPQGELHSWHEITREEWQADSVAKTELVVVVEKQKKFLVDRIDYPHLPGAPPIYRYKFEVDVHVVAAKTGEVLCRKRFINMPRPIKKVEEWRLTALGEPVALKTVFAWIMAQSEVGFSPNTTPIVTTNYDQ